MPPTPTPEPTPPQPPRRRPLVTFSPTALLFTVGGLIVGVILFVAVINAISSGEARSPVGSDLYVLGSAKALAGAVDEQGPLLLQDPLGSKRAIYVQHLAGDDWRTFDTRAPGSGEDCLVVWQPDQRVFLDRCSNAEYPADGAGLTSFPTRVDDDGKILIDLRAPQVPEPTTTTVAPATTTTVPPTTVAVPPA